MESFTIKGEPDFITLTIEVYGFPDKTCSWGGYDVKASVEIKSGNFSVKSKLWTSTGEIYKFYQELKVCNQELQGISNFNNYEGNLELTATYDKYGHVEIKGKFSELNEFDNILHFNFLTDQSFVRYTVNELELIVAKYGDNMGIIK